MPPFLANLALRLLLTFGSGLLLAALL